MVRELVNCWDFKAVEALCNQLYPTGHGMRAAASEVSVTYFGYLEHALPAVEMSPMIVLMGNVGDAVEYRSNFVVLAGWLGDLVKA